MENIYPCLWFDNQAEEAVRFYTSIFRNSKILKTTRYDKAGAEVSGRPEGSVLTVSFTLGGQQFMALNGGPVFQFTPAISFVVNCDTQEEVDLFWERLSDGGKKVQCGWLSDKYGISWQIVPTILPRLLSDPDPARAQRVNKAMLGMTKLVIKELKDAYEGK